MSDALESHLVHERGNRPPLPAPVDLVSVQSQLAYGHAGNSAAIPVLRMLGVRVAGVHAALESTLANGWEELDVLAAPAAALAEVPRFQAVPV